MLEEKKGMKGGFGVGTEKLLHVNGGESNIVQAWFAGAFKKGSAITVSVFLIIILLFATFLSTQWSDVVSPSLLINLYLPS